MYSPPPPEEIHARRILFEEFLQGHVQPVIEGHKKEAIEKVFFFNDQQFNEVCEDLKEEILRRKENGKLEFIPKYSLKRNTIREQISLLEEEELKSLVEDTYLVLKHKNAENPEDQLECLTVLVQSLEEIIGKSGPTHKGLGRNEDSPSAVVMSIEKLKQNLKTESEAERKIEILLEIIEKQVPDLNTQELLDLARVELNTIKRQKQKMTAEISTLKSEINDLYFEREMETDTTADEDTIEAILERITECFHEIEHTITAVGIGEVQKHLNVLNEERKKILEIAKNKNIQEIEDLNGITTEKDLLNRISKYYTAILTVIPK